MKVFGESVDGVFCFVGVDKGNCPTNSGDTLILDSCSKFTYGASCNVNLEDGKITFIEN